MVALNSGHAHDRLLLIDTEFNEAYTYNSFLLLAKSVGFKPDYKQFYDVTESSLACYGCIILNINGNFVNNYFNQLQKNQPITNPVIQKILDLIRILKKQKNKLVGIMLPSSMGGNAKTTFERAAMISKMCFPITDSLKKHLFSFLHTLMQPDHKRSFQYDTSLIPQNYELQKKNNEPLQHNPPVIINKTTNTIISSPLPLLHNQGTFPLAWYGSNALTNSHFFITKSSLMTFADIAESFVYNPTDFSVRLKKLEEVQQLLYELYRTTLLGTLKRSPLKEKPPLPTFFTRQFVIGEKKQCSQERNKNVNKNLFDWVLKEKIWCALATLDAYAKKEEDSVRSLLKLNLNLLWLQLSPEFYFSKEAVLKDQKDKFLEMIRNFTHALQKVSSETKEKIPKVFAGFEITGNFSQRPVANPVVDCYGEVYTKVPSPFDFKNLWHMELLDVFDDFYETWPTISNGVPLDGVFLDFEMYHAKDQTGHYTSIMDFSDCAWNVYCDAAHQQVLKKITTVDARIGYLMKHKKCEDYFKRLEREAFALGKQIKERIRKKLPNALIAIYDIYLPSIWFYKGITAGLSSPEEPVILATFNNDFYSHCRWLKKNNIYAYHLPVILLAKFKKIADFDLIGEAERYHDGVWFNRISRLAESRDSKDWTWDYGVEVTPLDTAAVVEQIRKQIDTLQKKI
jgi:hypothetical protein